jgi:hypothetical protein
VFVPSSPAFKIPGVIDFKIRGRLIIDPGVYDTYRQRRCPGEDLGHAAKLLRFDLINRARLEPVRREGEAYRIALPGRLRLIVVNHPDLEGELRGIKIVDRRPAHVIDELQRRRRRRRRRAA